MEPPWWVGSRWLASAAYPAALIIGSVLVVASLVLIRDAVVLGRDLRREPLDFAFEPAPSRGLLSPGTVFGLAGGVGTRPANAPRK
ncbi:hypothetical protein J4N02_16155 [Propioniciclava sp. MC1595]|uniref:hypothetical protein n=1 Tax=Propioniciclava sp. MC1595 TaxID=2760308 RepID=UPI001662430A|nr:hypothetical protein [Propioniciclava sp. MC1595]MBB1496380.1 hypothetical protein [Propioniciclava sp. MC1595]QTE25988.1 hypothetical protein J4N02_16155 [Propioniciclava sp. MC1595]